MNPTQIQTREAWLHNAIDALRPRFVEVGMPIPERIHISVGFGYGAKAESAKILGECWSRVASKDGVNHIFISPEVGDTARILDILIHELVHAADNNQSGHKGAFAEAATRLGLTGKMTATTASVPLMAEMMCLAETLGEYPHGVLDLTLLKAPVPVPAGPGVPAAKRPRISSGPAKQGTRMIKLSCASHGCECEGYTVRTSEKWIAVGMPMCPFGSFMQRD